MRSVTPHHPPLFLVFERRVEQLNRRRRDPSTIKNNIHALRKFDTWLRENDLEPASVSRFHAEEYFAELLGEYAVSTVKRHLLIVRAAYGYAIRRGEIDTDPTGEVELPRLADVEPETYTNTQLRSIRAASLSER